MYIGIVAEWNPFHTGHAHMIQFLKKSYPDADIAACMSGSFVQRGEPALFDKWDRASWALKNGVDLVTELPVLYVLQSADIFAEAGMHILYALGCDTIAFGCESLSVGELQEACSWALSSRFQTQFMLHLKGEGLPYGKAMTKTLEDYSPFLSKELEKPNNLLGFRYMLASIKNNFPFHFIAVRRDSSFPVSGQRVRLQLLNAPEEALIPETTKQEVLHCIKTGRYADMSRYYDACLLESRLKGEKELKNSGLFSEGLENRWFDYAPRYNRFNDFLDHLKNKRYLYSHLKRIAAALLLSDHICPSPFVHPGTPPYIRLLAVKKQKSYLLRRTRLPVITKTTTALRKLDNNLKNVLKMDIRGTDIASFCFKNTDFRKGLSDLTHSPVIHP